MTVDVSDIAGDVYGIVGTGIGLGVLSGMAGMTMRSMERNVYGRPYRPIYSREEDDYPRRYRGPYTKKSRKRKMKPRREYEDEEFEREPFRRRSAFYNPYTSRPPRLNIPRYW